LVQTVAELFYAALKHDLPNALAYRDAGGFQPISHQEVQARVERFALALEARGVRRGDRVGILSENRPEWAVADYACVLAGIVTVPIYPTLNLHQTAHILRNSRSRWVICSTHEQLNKLLELWPELPDLEAVVVMALELPEVPGRTLIHFQDLLAEGATMEARRPDLRVRSGLNQPDDLLTLIYTSGTTGDPKGVMLTHGNIASNMEGGLRLLQLVPGEKILSILPLSHIFERTCGHYIMFYSGVSIYYAESLQTIARDLHEVRPEVLIAVPRIYEKIFAKVREQVNSGSIPKRLIFHWANQTGRLMAPYLFEGRTPGLVLRLLHKLYDKLVYAKIRSLFGGRLRIGATGGAAIHPMILNFFWAAGVPILEGYGLTETSPIICLCVPGAMRPGYVGRPVLETWKGKPFVVIADDGEILCRGPNVMRGYWENEEATREAIDEEGYFHTGDIGEMDAEGRLKITDRKKELIVTSGGKNIAPQPIENDLRANKYIGQVVVIGEARNYLTALVVPNFEDLRRWADYKHLHYATNAELIALPEVQAKMMRRVERVNKGLSNYERIRKIALLDQELTADSGLLTPSLKIRRKAVNVAFADRIEKMYAEAKGE
jgi:long-chain acyl-CoA synthetase